MRSFFLTVYLFLTATAACSQTPAVRVTVVRGAETARDSVVRVLEKQVLGWNAGSIDEFMKGYWQSDSLKFITKNGVRYGYDSVALNYKKHYGSKEKMGTLSFTDLKCSSIGSEVMNVTGNWKVTETNGKSQTGIFSLIFRRINGEWKIVIDHTW